MKKLLAAVLLLTSTATFAKADPTEDFQIWIPVNTTVKLTDNVKGFLEVQPRFGHDAGHLDTGIVRPALGWSINKNWTIWGGYLMQTSRNAKTDEYSYENRSWEGLTYNNTMESGSSIEVRNRLEQRFLPHNGDISHRWRTRIRGEYVLNGPWSLIGSNEIFFNLVSNENDAQIKQDPAQNRAYVGVGYRFNTNFQIETGYLNQYVFNQKSKPDGSNNVWMTNVNLSF